MIVYVVKMINVFLMFEGIGCDRAFCGAYWNSQQVTRSDSFHMCAFDTFKPVSY